ncbi:acyltransferase [Neiella marina]|uniref:Acyltransferase n=1 Tax=Neiella holothuriorum TaxID=2870530 RepID=A0ABS7EJH5_9GAMM|nr:acyltransferase [Neiella holothuriorum]MBW8192484.1 acyltransferase [Neiella holothuriorum]
MMTTWLDKTRCWIKHSDAKPLQALVNHAKALRLVSLPRWRMVFATCYTLRQIVIGALHTCLRLCWWTPLFRAKVLGSCCRLYLYSGIPLISGKLQLYVGDSCRISGHTTFSGRSDRHIEPVIYVGNNVDIGWRTTIAVGRRVELHDNVRIAGECFLAGYPGHPLDANKRAQGLPCEQQQVGDIVLQRDVWLATGVKVMAGVCIGEGTVVAAGSVVCTSLPAGVLAGGVPARVIRRLSEGAA